MPIVYQPIFRRNIERFDSVKNDFIFYRKKLKKAILNNDCPMCEKILKELKMFSRKLNEFRYEFKGFLDCIQNLNEKILYKYEKMYEYIIEMSSETRLLKLEIKDFLEENSQKLKPIKIVRKLNKS